LSAGGAIIAQAIFNLVSTHPVPHHPQFNAVVALTQTPLWSGYVLANESAEAGNFSGIKPYSHFNPEAHIIPAIPPHIWPSPTTFFGRQTLDGIICLHMTPGGHDGIGGW
jgi:hypothetical protein